VRGRTDIFQFFTSEDIDGYEMDFRVAMLPGFGGGHVHDLAGTALDDDVTVLAECRALHGEGEGGPGTGLLKGLIVSLIVRHDEPLG